MKAASSQVILLALGLIAVVSVLEVAATSSAYAQEQTREWWNPFAWKWHPTDEEILKYRRSWNPMANGPILNTGVDIQPKG